MDRTSRCNKVDAVRLYASNRFNLILLKGQRCVIFIESCQNGAQASSEIPVLGFHLGFLKLGFKDLHKMVSEGGERTNRLEQRWS